MGRESEAASGAIVKEGAKLVGAHKYIKIWYLPILAIQQLQN